MLQTVASIHSSQQAFYSEEKEGSICFQESKEFILCEIEQPYQVASYHTFTFRNPYYCRDLLGKFQTLLPII